MMLDEDLKIMFVDDNSSLYVVLTVCQALYMHTSFNYPPKNPMRWMFFPFYKG